MEICVIGTGNVGSVLAERFAEVGHSVTGVNTSTPPERAAAQAAHSDVVVLAVPYPAVREFGGELKASLRGKVVIDATNPLSPDFMSLTVGHETSGGEQVAAALPGARVVKAFNTVFAATMATSVLDGRRLLLPVAGDDPESRKVAVELGTQLGFDAIDVGPMTNARYLEPVCELLVQLGYAQGLGERIGLVLARGR
ncbi:NADPH-dependent F420 reductase [Microtetraspora malaysiensis]|uniref:NADPH-dependent F420 reductase n=1 Tax=Microtetraspora malaysiensis TaxID=161358 RepID=UPI000830C6A3|nr:NADPH-dependent F420 reductase [Microtetraspora malaysiensis]